MSAELLEQLRRAGLVEPAVERAHDRRRAVPREQEAHRLDVRMDDVEALVLGPCPCQADRHVRRDVAAVPGRPEAALDRGHERAATDLGIAGRVEGDLVAALDQDVAERGDDPFRARVGRRRNGQHRRRDQRNPKRTVRGSGFPSRSSNQNGTRPGASASPVLVANCSRSDRRPSAPQCAGSADRSSSIREIPGIGSGKSRLA